ncbi:MAG: hypothetical protein KF768_06380 [Phycisphaeraceae bacterium]|nr:hypothetical protein [Phycisphaeraceae bacterium]
MAKYAPLRAMLGTRAAKGETRVTLSFAEIEEVLGEPLPRSAREYQAWWSNEARPQPVQKHSWTDAGYRVEHVDLQAGVVSFVGEGRG